MDPNCQCKEAMSLTFPEKSPFVNLSVETTVTPSLRFFPILKLYDSPYFVCNISLVSHCCTCSFTHFKIQVTPEYTLARTAHSSTPPFKPDSCFSRTTCPPPSSQPPVSKYSACPVPVLAHEQSNRVPTCQELTLSGGGKTDSKCVNKQIQT